MTNIHTEPILPVKRVKARLGFRERIIVDDCPYCHRQHVHNLGGSYDNMQRLADCFLGEYILEIVK